MITNPRSPALRSSAAVAAALVLTVSCSSSKSKGDSGTAPVRGNAVSVNNFAFTPQNLAAKAGTTVTWTFSDSVAHNVTESNNVFKSDDLTGGKTYTFTFAKAGKYSYTCTIHPQMKGTVTIS